MWLGRYAGYQKNRFTKQYWQFLLAFSTVHDDIPILAELNHNVTNNLNIIFRKHTTKNGETNIIDISKRIEMNELS